MDDGNITVADLYRRINLEKLGKIPGKNNKLTTNMRKYLGSIFMELIELAIDDIIDNNVTFKLTLMFDRKGTLQIRPIQGDAFKRLMQKGSFQGLDFLKTNFIGYRLFYSSNKRGIDRLVTLDNKNKQRIIDNANNGMKYF
jgi:hypothetical protein